MKNLAVLILSLVSAVTAAASSSKSREPYKIVCYLGSWANYRNGDGKFTIENIDPSLCTHLIYGFAKLSPDNKIAAYDPYLDLKENWGLGAFQRFNDLKSKNPGLKTQIAIGGWNEGSTKYSQMVSSPSSRKTFVDSCVDFISKYGFDGLDLDWEYPANRGGNPEDKQNFVSLIRELKEAFKSRGYLLSAAVSAGQSTIDTAYDIPALGRYLDFINLMTYDFHGGWEQTTGHNAPLYARPNDSEGNKKLNVDYAVKYWLSKGCPPQKLILGMPLYGRGFSLQNTQNNGLDAPISGKSLAGEYTKEPGMLGYNEICKMLKNEKGWTKVFEPSIQAPYVFKDRQWIGYDDPKSIHLKVKYLQKMNLGGGMIWSLETDDFRGYCHGEKYPLLRAIYEGLNGKSPTETASSNSIEPDVIAKNTPSTTAPGMTTEETDKNRPSTRAPELTTDETDKDMLPCPNSGYFRHPQDCKIFYYCEPKSATSQENTYYMFRCAEGTVFSKDLSVCTYPNTEPGC